MNFDGKDFYLPKEKITLSFREKTNNKKEITGTLTINIKKPKLSEFMCHSNKIKGGINNENKRQTKR